MKSVKGQSVKSVQSLKSVRSTVVAIEDRNTLDFDVCLTTACKKFACPCPVIIKRQDDFYKMMKKRESVKYKKISMVTKAEDTNENQLEKSKKLSGIDSSREPINSDGIRIHATYDNCNQLFEIGMKNVKDLPQILMQLIGKVVPYYPYLTKMFLKQCHINAYTIYELYKMLPVTSITDICLDGSPLPEGNYAILLDSPCRLNHISLSRCLINDEVCGQIASKLHFLASSEATLMSLNLSSNWISDVGAKLFADALRTNRHLRYLNLADNHITDDGAYSLFESLKEFPLSFDETINRRLRYMDYLKSRQALLAKYFSEWDSRSMDEYSQVSKKSTTKKKKNSATSLKSKQPARKEKPTQQKCVTDDYILLKAEMVAGEVMGPFVDPFSNLYINRKDNSSYSVGNMVLCYLNLSYNDLTYLSLKKLLSVILYQTARKSFNQPGLIKVLVDGNYMPNQCTEINQLNEILNKNIRSYSGKLFSELGGRRKSRTTRISVLPERKNN